MKLLHQSEMPWRWRVRGCFCAAISILLTLPTIVGAEEPEEDIIKEPQGMVLGPGGRSLRCDYPGSKESMKACVGESTDLEKPEPSKGPDALTDADVLEIEYAGQVNDLKDDVLRSKNQALVLKSIDVPRSAGTGAIAITIEGEDTLDFLSRTNVNIQFEALPDFSFTEEKQMTIPLPQGTFRPVIRIAYKGESAIFRYVRGYTFELAARCPEVSVGGDDQPESLIVIVAQREFDDIEINCVVRDGFDKTLGRDNDRPKRSVEIGFGGTYWNPTSRIYSTLVSPATVGGEGTLTYGRPRMRAFSRIGLRQAQRQPFLSDEELLFIDELGQPEWSVLHFSGLFGVSTQILSRDWAELRGLGFGGLLVSRRRFYDLGKSQEEPSSTDWTQHFQFGVGAEALLGASSTLPRLVVGLDAAASRFFYQGTPMPELHVNIRVGVLFSARILTPQRGMR